MEKNGKIMENSYLKQFKLIKSNIKLFKAIQSYSNLFKAI